MGTKALKYAVVSHGASPIAAHRHAQPVDAMAPDGEVNFPSARHDPCADRAIFTRHRARHQLPGQRGLSLRGAGNHEQAAGVLVKPVDQAGARQRSLARVESEQRILQRMRVISRSGMHDQPRGFVDDQAILVFMDDVERDLLGRDDARQGSRLDPDCHPAGRDDPVTGSCGLSGNLHCTRLDPALDAGAGLRRQQPRERGVKARAGHFDRNFKLDELELCTHGVLEADGGASGILPRFR